jgi:hypothetical protein
MSTTVRVIHAYDFIKATAEGQLDFEASKKLLLEIASATISLVDYEVLLDSRHAQSDMSMTDLWNLATAIGNLDQILPRKIAVLCPRERFDQAGFFALCAENKGFKVRAFTGFEDAMTWLTSKKPDLMAVFQPPDYSRQLDIRAKAH